MSTPDLWVIKRNVEGEETWRYPAWVLRRKPGAVLIEAYFNRPDTLFREIPLGQGDRFIEAYYSDRWYNLFEIHDRLDDRLKGWYCNVTLPAEIDDHAISYIDLALDLLVYPDGRQLVLDEDEFTELAITPEVRRRAQEALQALQDLFTPAFSSLLSFWETSAPI
ncbi:MAG: DUF402 domain-containing protein [Anaerolineaceae bacterium]|jgi:hypothetical protein